MNKPKYRWQLFIDDVNKKTEQLAYNNKNSLHLRIIEKQKQYEIGVPGIFGMNFVKIDRETGKVTGSKLRSYAKEKPLSEAELKRTITHAEKRIIETALYHNDPKIPTYYLNLLRTLKK